MSEVNYNEAIAALSQEIVDLKQELDYQKEVTKIWFDLAHEREAVLEPIIAVIKPLAEREVRKEINQTFYVTPKTIIKADDNE